MQYRDGSDIQPADSGEKTGYPFSWCNDFRALWSHRSRQVRLICRIYYFIKMVIDSVWQSPVMRKIPFWWVYKREAACALLPWWWTSRLSPEVEAALLIPARIPLLFRAAKIGFTSNCIAFEGLTSFNRRLPYQLMGLFCSILHIN